MSALAFRAKAAYQVTHVESRSPLELVALAYDGLAQSLMEGREAMARRDLFAKRTAVNRALAILFHLQNTLDLEKGGHIAAQLHSLYTYISGRVIAANAVHDVDALDEAIRLVAPLRDAWSQLAAGEVTTVTA